MLETQLDELVRKLGNTERAARPAAIDLLQDATVFLNSRVRAILFLCNSAAAGTALVTPFHQDGSIDDAALRSLVAWQIESGIDFLVPCGTTCETPTLTHLTNGSYVIDATIEVAAGRVPIVACESTNWTYEVVEQAKEVAARSGVNAILTASPYYNKPTQEGQYRHFKAIAEAVGDKPIILYNVPGRTAANLEPATLARLAEIPNIVGVKEASGNMTQIAESISAVPETFLVSPVTTRSRFR